MADQRHTVDFAKACQNLTDILIDDDKFLEFCKNMYDACDTDNVGVIAVKQVEIFIRDVLRGDQKEGFANTSFEKENEEIFKLLEENESGEVTFDELSKFLLELLKNQVSQLQRRVEVQKYERSIQNNGQAE